MLDSGRIDVEPHAPAQQARRVLEIVLPEEVIGDGQALLANRARVDEDRDEGGRADLPGPRDRRAPAQERVDEEALAQRVHGVLAAVDPIGAAGEDRRLTGVVPVRAAQLRQGGRRGDGVVVHEPHEFGAARDRPRNSDGETAGPADVALHRHDVGDDAVPARDLGGLVRGGVIDDDDVIESPCLGRERVERVAQHRGPVEGNDDRRDRSMGHAFMSIHSGRGFVAQRGFSDVRPDSQPFRDRFPFRERGACTSRAGASFTTARSPR